MEEKKENIKKGGSSFLAYKITRKNGGTSFFFKSERLEKFFKFLAGEKIMMKNWKGVFPDETEYYPVVQVQLNNIQLDRWGYGFPINDRKVNLSVLRKVGLKDGFTFSVSIPFSERELLDLSEKIKEGIKELYQQYIKAVDIAVDIIVNETISTNGEVTTP